MSEFLKLIDSYINPDSDESVQIDSLNSIVIQIHQKKFTVLKLVENLADYLTNQNESIRSRGTSLLSETLARLPSLGLNKEAIQYLVTFFCDRLQDYPCQAAVLKGLFALLKNHSLEEESVDKIIRAIHAEVNVQSQTQSTRKIVFDIISLSLTTHLSATKKMKHDFVFGFIQAMDGEKDPRNLLLLFTLVPIVVREFPDFVRFKEELFEIVSCYFPVTFKPKPGDPNAVSKSDLSDALRNCLLCTSEFAEFLIPFLLDKLSSTVAATKLESLDALKGCINSYDSSKVTPHLEDIWSAIRTEIFTAKEVNIIEASGETLQALVSLISKNPNELQKVDSLLSQAMQELRSKDGDMIQSSGEILVRISKVSPLICKMVLNKAIPEISLVFQSSKTEDRIALLEVSVRLLQVYVQTSMDSSDFPKSDFEKLGKLFQETYTQAFGSPIEKTSIRCLGATGLGAMMKFGLLNNDDSIRRFIGEFTDILTSDSDQALKDRALVGLTETEQEQLILQITVPKLVEILNKPTGEDGDVTMSDSDKPSTRNLAVQSLARLAQRPSILKSVFPALSNLITLEHLDKVNSNAKSTLRILAGILTSLKTEENQNFCSEILIRHLMSLVIGRSLKNESAISSDLLQSVLRIFREISRNSPKAQSSLVKDIFDIVFGLKFDSIKLSTEDASNFKGKSESQKQSRLLFYAALQPLNKEVEIPFSDEILLHLTSDCKDHQLGEFSSQTLSLVINKMGGEEKNIKYINDLVSNLIKEVENSEGRKYALQALLWVAKSQLVKGSEIGTQIAQQMCDDLNKSYGVELANGFDILMNDEVLNRENHAVIRVLYKQKFFVTFLPKLLSGFNNAKQSSDESLRANYLIAISGFLRHIPKSILKTELPKILPLLVESLVASDSQVALRQSAVETLASLIHESADLSELNLAQVIPALLRLSEHDKLMSVRISAIECIYALHHAPSIVDFVVQIKSSLRKCLDDKKRLVRKEAQKTLSVYK